MSKSIEIDVEKIPWKIPLGLAHSLQGMFYINMLGVAHGQVLYNYLGYQENYLKRDNF